MTDSILVTYLKHKREDDLSPGGRSDVGAAGKAIRYLRGWRPDIYKKQYTELLTKAGHPKTAINTAMKSWEDEQKEMATT